MSFLRTVFMLNRVIFVFCVFFLASCTPEQKPVLANKTHDEQIEQSLELNTDSYAEVAHLIDDSSQSFTVLHINDVYRIYGVDEGTKGSFSRLRTLRQKLESSGKPVLVLHAGDFLFPSMMSRTYKGKQMIDVMNAIDGELGVMDENFFTVFGNHEFDLNKEKHAAVLQERINESEFYWLGTNVSWKLDKQGKPVITSDKILPYKLLDLDGIKVGIFGVTTDLQTPSYASIDSQYVDVAKNYTQLLRNKGAEVVIALTHLRIQEDKEILRSLNDQGPDIIFGGHEHNQQAHKVRGRYVVKADADMRSATIANFEYRKDSGVDISFRFINIDEKLAHDPAVESMVEQWQKRYDRRFCKEAGDSQGCLDIKLGRTNVTLVGEELEVRRYETNLGDFILDEVLKHFKPDGVQLAFLNSGSIRINQDIPQGTILTERHLRELFQYPSEMVVIKISGKVLAEVLNHSVKDWTGNGRWLQIAGFRYFHDVTQETASKIQVRDSDGNWRNVKPDEEFLAVTNDFLMNPLRGQDGYKMLVPAMIQKSSLPKVTLINLIRTAIKNASPNGISPTIDGRICSSDFMSSCSF